MSTVVALSLALSHWNGEGEHGGVANPPA